MMHHIFQTIIHLACMQQFVYENFSKKRVQFNHIVLKLQKKKLTKLSLFFFLLQIVIFKILHCNYENKTER
jgi:hypothetical protein